jgi:hypothetical protein
VERQMGSTLDKIVQILKTIDKTTDIASDPQISNLLSNTLNRLKEFVINEDELGEISVKSINVHKKLRLIYDIESLKDRLDILHPTSYDHLEARINILVKNIANSFDRAVERNILDHDQKQMLLEELNCCIDGSGTFDFNIIKEKYLDFYYKVTDEFGEKIRKWNQSYPIRKRQNKLSL